MSKSAITLLVIAIIAGAVQGATVYTDRAAWEAAIPTYEEEFFTDTTLNTGLSVVSDNGFIDGVWRDQVNDGNSTTWYFDDPITGFGGNWDLAFPSGPGIGIKIFLDGVLVEQEIPNTTAGTFWGVANGPFDEVLLTGGTQGSGRETYVLYNMVYGVPEPATLILLSIGAMMLRKRKTSL